MIAPTPEERAQRDAIAQRLIDFTRGDVRIKLPPFDPARERGDRGLALLSIVDAENPFGGAVGPYRYQFEGEDDLLHLFVVRADGAEFSVPEAQAVVGFALDGVPPALIWLRPGTVSHHFYVGHDVLVESLVVG